MMPQQPDLCTDPDAEIVRRLKNQDPTGLQQLLHKYGGRVKSSLRQELGSVLDASELDEVLNRAAYLAWRHARTYSAHRGRLGTWFYIIARNAALAMIREETPPKGKVLDDVDFATLGTDQAVALGHGAASMLSASGTAMDEPAEPSARQIEYTESLRACVAKLPPLQRQIIQADLQTGDVANAAELAQMLNTSKNSIYVSRSSARKNLRRGMRRLGYFGGDQEEDETERTA
jgi:RNA polymerase sigma factor (sigma-70 family)